MGANPKALLSAMQALPEPDAAAHLWSVIRDASDLAERLVAALDQARVSDSALAKACGVTPQAVSGWKRTGRVHKRHLGTIAAFTGKSVQWLLGDQGSDPLEQQLLQMYRALPPDSRDKLLAEANWLVSQLSDRPTPANPYPSKARR